MSGDHVEMTGVVIDIPKGHFKVDLGNDNIVIARLSGKMRQNNIMVLLGDTVRVKLSPFDLTNGILVARL